jgi:hypothetical protein
LNADRIRSSSGVRWLPLLGVLLLGPAAAAAVSPSHSDSPLTALSFVSDRLQARPELEPVEEIETSLGAPVRNGWSGFRGAHGTWSGVVDKRHGGLEIAEGEGIPFLPGRGNRLTRGDIAAHLGNRTKPDLATLESITRAFLPEIAPLLGVDAGSLALNAGRSGQPSDEIWFVDFDVVRGGIPIDGARVVFRVNHGNLIQFGTENLPAPGLPAPQAKLTREEALANLSAYVGGFSAADRFLDGGSLHLLPVRVEDARFAEGYEIGKGRGLTPAWQFLFRRAPGFETWRARVDAVSGEMLELVDTNDYAQVTGNARILGTSTLLPMPFADVSSGGATNSAGVYSYPGGTVTSSLNGTDVRVADACGAISLASDIDGNIGFGTSAGTDCTTPGTGGAGNTHSARTQFYHLNRAKETARGWLPANAWLAQKLTANVDLDNTCNAFWNGSTVNFYRSGGGCGNTGEIEGVSLHEYGHGLDSNDGNGSAPDKGTGETYGDWTAALATHSSCIGAGFRTTNCGGYSDTCTACTGVRDIDWGKHASNTAHTVANFTQARCPTSPIGYIGPCGREGHCESHIASEALWDFVNRDLPSPGSGAAWTIADRLWYLSRSTATAAFACTAGATFTSNGCNTGSLWKALRAVDDDDGNLANGTPNSAALYAAFNRHGIACTTDPGANVSFRGCTRPATPTLALTGGDNQVTLSWSGASGVYDVFRNERGCNAGFIKIANDLAGTPLVDTNVANGFTYYYQVVAQPAGNESCGSAPSTCLTVTPSAPACTTPAVPSGIIATTTGAGQVAVSWPPVAGATLYRVYRAATAAGPFLLAGTSPVPSVTDTQVSCGSTYVYKVRAAAGSSCESATSAPVTGGTAPCPPCSTQTLYSNGFESGTGLTDWTAGVFSATGSTVSWRGAQTCTAHNGSKVLRYGGAGCTDNYANSDFSFAQPGGTAGITVPAGAQSTRLSFWHRRSFEAGFDGGTLALSLDGAEYFFVPASAITGGTTYNGPLANDCLPAGATGVPTFTGSSPSFTETVVDLDAACNEATGGAGGCGGQAVRIGFTTITDCGATDDGWFLDDVKVDTCIPIPGALDPTDFYTLPPCRLIDTRLADGPLGGPVLQPGVERSFAVAGACGIPAGAKALALNVTVFQPTSFGNVQVYPGDTAPPVSSTINFLAGDNRANNAITPLAFNGAGTLKARAGSSGTVHLIVDVTGYFQ